MMIKRNAYEAVVNEFFEAVDALHHAEINYQTAEDNFLEIACQELADARSRVNTLHKKAKLLYQG